MTNSTFKYFAIFGSMRSGSNLLEQSLNQFSQISCHGELFNPAFIGGPNKDDFLGFSVSDREKNPNLIIDAMIEDKNKNIQGFRIFEGHDPRIIKHALEDPECAKIILQRDLVESFISLKIAGKTGQWLLRNAPQRKSTTVYFDAGEFQKYAETQNEYYRRIRHTLQKSGQTAYWITYPEQKDLEVLNGTAKFVGASEKLKSVKEPLKRQNPETLREKVENYPEMMASLGRGNDGGPVAATTPQLRANIPKMVTCISHPLLFTPIPGGPNEEVLRWMNKLDGGTSPKGQYLDAVIDAKILHTGHSQRTLFEWMQSNPDVISFTAVRHPVVRAYNAFMTKIFPVGPHTYDVIRKQLIQLFDVDIPDAEMMSDLDGLMDAGYELKHHRAAFHKFLRFLHFNLAGQTSIRVDGLWANQMSFVTGFNSAVPVSLTMKEGRLDPSFRYVENLLEIAKPKLGAPLKSGHVISLNDIYTRQTENLARKAYAIDYTRFGFEDYQAALDD